MLKALSTNLFPHEKRLTGPAYGLLVLFCLAVFLPGFFTQPVFDRDEPSFAQASKQMIETGNLIDIRFQDDTRYKKPVGIYWMQLASVRLVAAVMGKDAEHTIWPYRIPALLGAILAVLLTAAMGSKLMNAETGFAAAIMLASCLILNVEARLAKTDAVLLAAILACQFVLAKAYMQQKPLKLKDFLIFWLALGAGFLIKGPLIFIGPLATIVTLKLLKSDIGFAGKLKPLWGIPLALVVILPWFIAITHETAGAFYKDSAGHDLFAKIWEVQNWGHYWFASLPGLYALMMPLTLWPASLPLLLAIPYIWACRHDRDVRFCIAWVLPIWLIFEFTLTKLPHYTMPAYPALCLLAMRWLLSGLRDTARPIWNNFVYIMMALITLMLVLLPATIPIMLEGTLFYWALFTATLTLGAVLASIYLLRKHQPQLALAPLPIAGVTLMVSLFGALLPGLTHLFPSEQIMAHLPEMEGCEEPQLATAGYSEPSLVFLAGTKTQLLNVGERLAVEMKRNPCLIGVVDSGQRDEFLAKAPLFQLTPQRVAYIEGFSIGRGKKVELEIYRSAPDKPRHTPQDK